MMFYHPVYTVKSVIIHFQSCESCICDSLLSNLKFSCSNWIKPIIYDLSVEDNHNNVKHSNNNRPRRRRRWSSFSVAAHSANLTSKLLLCYFFFFLPAASSSSSSSIFFNSMEISLKVFPLNQMMCWILDFQRTVNVYTCGNTDWPPGVSICH